jgi:ribonuclease E
METVATEKAEPVVAGNAKLDTTEDAAEAAPKKPRAPRRRKPAEAKPVDLSASGLQLVETKPSTSATPEPEAAPEAPKPRRAAAWQQKAAEQQQPEGESLVMVETQK